MKEESFISVDDVKTLLMPILKLGINYGAILATTDTPEEELAGEMFKDMVEIFEREIKNFDIQSPEFRVKDRIESSHSNIFLAGEVLQSYLHLESDTIKAPHIRYKVLWDSGNIEDLSQSEINLEK